MEASAAAATKNSSNKVRWLMLSLLIIVTMVMCLSKNRHNQPWILGRLWFLSLGYTLWRSFIQTSQDPSQGCPAVCCRFLRTLLTDNPVSRPPKASLVDSQQYIVDSSKVTLTDGPASRPPKASSADAWYIVDSSEVTLMADNPASRPPKAQVANAQQCIIDSLEVTLTEDPASRPYKAPVMDAQQYIIDSSEHSLTISHPDHPRP